MIFSNQEVIQENEQHIRMYLKSKIEAYCLEIEQNMNPHSIELIIFLIKQLMIHKQHFSQFQKSQISIPPQLPSIDLGNQYFVNQQVLEQFDNVLAINPKFLYSLHNKGTCLFNLGQYQQAIEWYNKALIINHVFLKTLICQGLCQMKRNN